MSSFLESVSNSLSGHHRRHSSLTQSIASSLASLAEQIQQTFFFFGSAGGRAPEQDDKIDVEETFEATENEPDECRLILLQITDVYTLENLASFKTLVADIRQKSRGATVVAILTGDFLSPYLLSTVDRGMGMMQALNAIPLDYIIWGNHEADIEHKTVCRHVRNFKGKWINSNMLDHEAMDAQIEYDVIQLQSLDGTHTRKVGLCAVLDNNPKLYAHFKEPGPFGGATITDPWEALAKYKKLLEQQEQCDLVVPLEHLYVPDDHITCEKFDFPVILSGHDHHRVDEVYSGSRLIKSGQNAEFASVVEISWQGPNNDASSKPPKIRSRFVRCKDWQADPVCAQANERAYDALIPLRKTELAQVPSMFEPLSSNGSRSQVCTMGKYICTLIKSSLHASRQQRNHIVDAVLLMGGNIRGNTDYPPGSFFSLEALEAEIKSDEVIAVVPMPGWLLAEGIQATHAGDPIPGWMQYDHGVIEDTSVHPPVVTHVAGTPLENNRIYRVATKISDLTNGQSPPWTRYYKEHPELLPIKGGYVNIQSELLGFFARNLFRKLWTSISEEISKTHNNNNNTNTLEPKQYLQVLDQNGDGTVSIEEIQLALCNILGVSIDKREMTFAKFVHDYADATGNGKVTIADIRHFVKELNEDGDTTQVSGEIRLGKAARDDDDDSDLGLEL